MAYMAYICLFSYSAHIVETNETVAIKKVFVDRRYRNRELQTWREMHHPNIVTLKVGCLSPIFLIT